MRITGSVYLCSSLFVKNEILKRIIRKGNRYVSPNSTMDHPMLPNGNSVVVKGRSLIFFLGEDYRLLNAIAQFFLGHNICVMTKC
jgi:hypothetical protein